MAGTSQDYDRAHGGRGIWQAGLAIAIYRVRANQRIGVAMTGFDDREKAFENKYKHDQELKFKVNARRNKLLGEWAGRQFGLSGDALADYAKSVVMSDFDRPGDDDVLQKVAADCKTHGLALGEGAIRAEMEKLLEVAKQQILTQS
jgi:hypothetical protein